MFRVAGLGECMVEFFEEGKNSWRMSFGGDVLNCLVALSQQKVKSAFISRLGNDFFKDFLLNKWKKFVDLSHVSLDKKRLNGIYFINDFHGNRCFQYYRKDSAASFTLAEANLDELIKFINGFDLFFFSGVALAVMKEREKWFYLLRNIDSKVKVGFDPNYREALWKTPEEFKKELFKVMEFVDFAFPSLEDEEKVFGRQSDSQILERYLNHCELVALKKGSKGCIVADNSETVSVKAFPVKVVGATGAGDAFNAGAINAILEGKPLKEIGLKGNALAAMNLGFKGAIPEGLSLTKINNFIANDINF